MIYLMLMSSLAAAAPQQQAVVHHRGNAYEVNYQPQVRASMKTVGMSAGTRMSTERCSWRAEVQVERTLRRQGEALAHAKLLPAATVIEGSRHGSCAQAREAVDQDQLAKLDHVQQHLAQVAARDRATLLADIDAAHSLASAD